LKTKTPIMKPIHALAAGLFVAAGLACAAMPPLQNNSLSGEVLETQNVDSYTYVRLKTSAGEFWAAVPRATLKNGSRIQINHAMVMDNFESKTLKKKFEHIVFGQLADASAAPAAMPHPAPAPAPVAAAAVPVQKLAKATGADARTVAEVVNGKATLKDKPVAVRGKVVKVSLGIMGKNWVHLQDGSGTSADGSNDILVTTKDVVALGDIVNARGTVRTDVTVGPGYAYAVMIDNAELRK
jgi:hypothetical protein